MASAYPAWCMTVDHRENGRPREVTFPCHTRSGERIFALDSTLIENFMKSFYLMVYH